MIRMKPSRPMRMKDTTSARYSIGRRRPRKGTVTAMTGKFRLKSDYRRSTQANSALSLFLFLFLITSRSSHVEANASP